MKKHCAIVTTILAILFWIVVTIALFNLTGCASFSLNKKINWKDYPYDPTQQIDLRKVPDIIVY